MERLTMRNADGIAFWVDHRCAGGGYRMTDDKKGQERLDRLSAYEDTGLSPETVSDLLERFHSLYKIFDDLDLVDRVHFQAFLEQVRRWHHAKKDGRLVVLPNVQERDRKSFVDGLRDYFQEASFYDPSTEIFGMSEGEKELASALMNALTREEAESALKKREAYNEAD